MGSLFTPIKFDILEEKKKKNHEKSAASARYLIH